MQKIRCGFIAFIFLLSFHGSSTAQSVTDSLIKSLNTALPDSQRLENLSLLAWEFVNSNLKLSENYSYKELQLAKKLNNRKYIAQARNDLGIVYFRSGKFRESIAELEEALTIRRELGDSSGVGSAYSKLGLCYHELFNWKKALNYQLQALRIFEKENSEMRISYTLNNLCAIYRALHMTAELREAANRAMEICRRTGDKGCLANGLNNETEYYESVKDYKKALELQMEASALQADIGDSSNLSISLNNTGYLLRNLNRTPEAITYYKKAIAMARKIKDRNNLAFFLSNIASVYNEKKQYPQALAMLNESEKIALEDSLPAVLKQVYFAKATSLLFLNREVEAENYLQLYRGIADTLFNSDVAKQTTQMHIEYETERKEQLNELLTKDNSLKQAIINSNNLWFAGIGVSLVLLSIITILLVNRNRMNQKRRLDLERQQLQNQRTQAVIDAEEQERIRIARELHDGIGQQLAAAKLTLGSLHAETVEQDELITNAIHLIDDAVIEVRSVSHAMLANLLIRSGLMAAVRDFVQKLSNAKALKVDLEIIGLEQRLDARIEGFMFRILQEIVSNVIRHSGATELSIQLIAHEDELVLMVEDNGKGFNPISPSADGIGLKNIQTRVEYLSGNLQIDSYEGRGTTISVTVPIKFEVIS